MLQKLNIDEMEELMHSQVVGRIGCHADDLTYVVPISYGYDGRYLYGRTFEGKKLDMLRKNPKICFQVDDTHNLSNWKSVICWGEFEELRKTEEQLKAIDVLQSRHIPLVPSQTLHLTAESPFAVAPDEIDGVLFRVKIAEKTGMSEVNVSKEYYAT